MTDDYTEPEFMTPEEFTRHREIAKDAFARVLSFEFRTSYEDARSKINEVSADLDDYLRHGAPHFWMSIIRTRIYRKAS